MAKRAKIEEAAASNGDVAVAAAPKKTKCPIDRRRFEAQAPAALPVAINGQPMAAGRRTFSTGSLGWHLNDKVVVMIDGEPCKAQVNLSVTLVGSKELPKQ